jgi:hypothetical protein
LTEDRRQKTEDRRQKTEDRRQKTEDRRQKTEDNKSIEDYRDHVNMNFPCTGISGLNIRDKLGPLPG